jgi:hypothetical protein
MQRYYMIFREEKVYITSDSNDKVVEYTVDNLNKYPNIPFYYCF